MSDGLRPVVLVIEDEPGDALLIKRQLLDGEPDAFTVHLADSLAVAKRLVEQDGVQPDAVLLDLNLPDSSGIATIERCRAQCSAPVVVMTGLVDSTAIQAAIQSGAEDYLSKGADIGPALRKAVRYAMLRFQRDADARLAATVFKHSREGILITTADATILEVNESFSRITGYARAEVVGQNPRLLASDTQAPAFYAEMWQRLLTQGHWQGEIWNRRKNGELYAERLNISAVRDAAGRIQQYVGLFSDITEELRLEEEQQRIQRALQESEQRFRDIAGVSADWIWEVDAQGRYTYASESVKGMLGYAPEEILGKTPFDFMTADEARRVGEVFGRLVAAKSPFSDLENIVLGKDGTAHITLTNGKPILGAAGELLGYRGVDRDITERKQAEEKIRQLAFYDPLTQLPNRRLLCDRLNLTMAASKRSGLYGCVMFLDLDNFKPLNDLHGHLVGDLLLIDTAARLKACVREVDTVARLGGDEFVVMISELDVDQAESAAQAGRIAEKIRVALAAPYRLSLPFDGMGERSVEHQCTASIGVALFLGQDVSQTDILERADAAMYQAKEAGRNQIRFSSVLELGRNEH